VLEEAKARAGGALARVPLVVLVNEYTASSSELVAGAVQDTRAATIIGAQTFGKGSVQTIFELPGGGGMRLTTMRYYTPGGRSIQALGIEPDVLVKPAKTSTVIREKDLQGHLSAEATGSGRPGQVVLQSPADAGLPTLRIADIPLDPSKGKDFALAKAFESIAK
jgi:carboxyl-terminal processing protease